MLTFSPMSLISVGLTLSSVKQQPFPACAVQIAGCWSLPAEYQERFFFFPKLSFQVVSTKAGSKNMGVLAFPKTLPVLYGAAALTLIQVIMKFNMFSLILRIMVNLF